MKMKKTKTVLSVVVAAVLMFSTGCSKKAPQNKEEDKTPVAAENSVDLQGYYTVKDPEGIDFDTRVVIYMDESSANEVMTANNVIANYMVFYGKGESGKYLTSIYVCKSEEDATSFVKVLGQGTVEGKIIITTSGEEAFLAMADAYPKMSSYIDAMCEAGYMPLK